MGIMENVFIGVIPPVLSSTAQAPQQAMTSGNTPRTLLRDAIMEVRAIIKGNLDG